MIICNYDLVKALCNFGADIKIKTVITMKQLNFAIKYSECDVTEMIFDRQLSGLLGNDFADIASDLHDKRNEDMDICIFPI